MKYYDLVIVTGEPFPIGKAATNRILCYASKLAHTKRIAVYTWAALYGVDYKIAGRYLGVDYYYMQKPSKRPSKLNRLITLIIRYLKLYFFLILFSKSHSVLYVSRNVPMALLIKLALSIKGVKMFREVSEVPTYTKNSLKKNLIMYSNKIYDGIIVISSSLGMLIGKFARKRAKFFELPILVYMDRFAAFDSIEKKKKLFYCSGGNVERDGLLDTLNGFLMFKKRTNDAEYTLEIATSLNLNDEYHKQVHRIIISNSDTIIYKGSLPTTEIPKLLTESSILMMTPHENYKSKGFPTKLGEYFASGTPVICSAIDDLKEQITPDVVKFVEPNNVQDVCDAIIELVKDKEKATAIGLRGRDWVIKKYTMDSYVDSMIEFLGI